MREVNRARRRIKIQMCMRTKMKMGMATEWRLEVSLFGLLGLATN